MSEPLIVFSVWIVVALTVATVIGAIEGEPSPWGLLIGALWPVFLAVLVVVLPFFAAGQLGSWLSRSKQEKP